MLRRTLRRLRFALFAVLTTVVIALAVLVGLTQLAMPWLVRNPERIEAWISERVHQPVHIGHVTGAWLGGGPALTLEDVRIGVEGGDKPVLKVPRAEIAFDLYAPFQGERAWSEFRLVGLDVRLVHADDGWHMLGIEIGSAPSAAPSDISMGALGALVLKDFKLGIDDPAEDVHLALAASELRVDNRGSLTHIAGKVRNLAAGPAPLDLIADVDMNRRSGTLYAGGREVDIGQLAGQRSFAGVQLLAGRGNVQVWVKVEAAKVDDLRLKVDLADALFATGETIPAATGVDISPRAHLDRLAFVARWTREESGWTADVADLVLTRGTDAPSPARIGIERRGAETATYRAAATNLSLEPIGSLAMLTTRAPEGLRRWLYLAHPQGTLTRASLRWNGAEDFDAEADLLGLGFAMADRIPGVEHLDAEIRADAAAMMLRMPVQPLRVDYQRVFRKPFLFSQFGGDVVAFRTDDAWRIETDRVAFEGENFGGELRGGIEVQDDHTRPLLDLYAVVTHADVTAAKLFWPTTSMAPQVIQFLDRAIVEGRLDEGRVVVRGDLDSWPFHDESGRFEARGHVIDTVFDYNPEWPRAEHLDAVATFIGDSMQVEVASAEVKGIRVSGASASIASFADSVLDLSAKGSGSGANLLAFVRGSPIGKSHEDTLKDIAIGGKGDLAFTMHLPIKDGSKVALEGTVMLSDANLDDEAFNLHFVDANGVVRFNQTGFAAGPLAVGFRQRPAKLAIATGGYAENSRNSFEANLVGRFPATTVFADVPDLAPALTHFPGESDWTAKLTIESSNDPAGGHKQLSVSSDLVGTSIDLPSPLSKAAETAQPFRLNLDLPFVGQNFTAKLGSVAEARGRLPAPGKPLAARVELGASPSQDLPARGIAIGGRVATFDAGGWLDLVQGKGEVESGGSDSLIQTVDIRADDFRISDRNFGATRLVVSDNAGMTELKLDGPGLAGTLTIPGKGHARDGVTARMARFHWPDAPQEGGEDSSALPDVAPSSLPALHIAVDDFVLGKASFGAAQFESYPTADGMHIDKLESKSPNVNMSASGDWTGTAKNNRSHLVITMTAQNLGHMMDALGFPGLIDGGQTTANIDALWAGPPSAFALPKLQSGAITLKVAEGRILDVNPGAGGRIFGLLSLSEIPRRLTLDFSDFFKSGLSFNSITGTFGLDNGNAYTSDLIIKSPAADIVITGRTGLRTRDYDQQMVVSPHTGATLPIVGAIAGGPVGAAAGLVLQGVLGKPLGKAIGSRYQVSGSWDKPQITLIAKENPRAKPGDAKPEGGELH